MSADALRVFGGLRLVRDGAEVDLGPARQRAILAVLLAARGEVVTVTDLTDTLWGQEPPPSAANQIQRHVGELRRILEPGLHPREAGTRLLGAGAGYRLETGRIDSELERFYALRSRARSTARADERAALFLEAATAAAAPAFAGMAWDLLSRPAVTAIAADRMSTICEAADAIDDDLLASALVPPLGALAAETPLDEHVQARWMTLLVRVGRRSDALLVFDDTRKRLVEALGIGPGGQLRAAHLAIVSDEPRTLPDVAAVPAFLPVSIHTFVDRNDVRPLLRDLTAGSTAILSGMGGVGKTTLAVAWAREIAADYPDGHLYVNLQGYSAEGDALSSDDATNLLLEQLGQDVSGGTAATRTSAYRRYLAERRMIILLDNARDAAQARPLLAGARGCLTIVTSRDRLSGLVVREAARSIPLRLWTADESRRLLAGRLGQDRVTADAEAIESIIDACAGLPLALAITAARYLIQPNLSVQTIARELAVTSARLDSLSTGEVDNVRVTFEWSYHSLDADARRMFRHISAHPGPRMSLASLATCADVTVAEARRVLARLLSANMVTEAAPDRFELHDLLRAYSEELLQDAGEQSEAQTRLTHHYVHSTREAFLQFGRTPTIEVDVGLPRPDSIERFKSTDHAIEWYATERSVLKAIIRRSSELGLDKECALMVLDWRPMSQSLDSAGDTLPSSRLGLAAAVRVGDDILAADLSRDVGSKLARMGAHSEAEPYLLESLRIFSSRHDYAGEANAYRNLTLNASWEGRHDQELEYVELSLSAARRSGQASIIASALAAVGGVRMRAGSLAAAVDAFEESNTLLVMASLDYMRPEIASYLAEIACMREDFVEARRQIIEGRSQLAHNIDVLVESSLMASWALSARRLGLVEEAREAVEAFDPLQQFGLVEEGEGSVRNQRELGWVGEARDWLAALDASPRT
jgi:DNA-binding SARP family transcriptional activator